MCYLYRASDKDTSSVTASVISTDNGRTGTFNPRTKGKNQSKYYFQIDGLKNGDETFDALVTFDGAKIPAIRNSRERHKRIRRMIMRCRIFQNWIQRAMLF